MIIAARRQRETPFDNPLARFMAGRFGIWLFLASLGMLFGATILGFIVIRVQLHGVWPHDLPALPPMLLMSTAVLMLSSLSLQWALNGIRIEQPARLRAGLWLTSGLAMVFLLLQTASWFSWLGVVSSRWAESAEHRFALTSFYVMTGLHALHVIGGLIPMLVVTVRSGRRAYSADHYAGVWYTTAYWHFLGAVWLLLYATLLIGT